MSENHEPLLQYLSEEDCNFSIPITGWYFLDESWDLHGPYCCEWMARGQLCSYLMNVLGVTKIDYERINQW